VIHAIDLSVKQSGKMEGVSQRAVYDLGAWCSEAIPAKETKMGSKISTPRDSPSTLLDKAAECLEIAQLQHDAADSQHLNANKLDELGHALVVSAVELEGKAQMGARSGPIAPAQPRPPQIAER